ncbi:MAG TPA: N-acetylmuramoyl-L-alanine amidase [bacterium]|jgi:N-acetylmuramoyl-L-alanine amidase|nr:N-acetylmuramoyl-L-alanine amidase [bacterium]
MRRAAALVFALALAAGLAAKAVILLDPGHGGADAGVQAEGFKESDFTLDMARRMKPLLEARGLDVELTRDSDVDLSPSARVALANGLQPLALVSLHANAAFQAGAHGVRIFVPSDGAVDEPAAPLWQQASRLKASYSKSLGMGLARALGVGGPRPVQSLKLALFRGLSVPGCLVECEFASQPEGLAALKDPAKRDEMARRLSLGIANWALGGAGAEHAQ